MYRKQLWFSHVCIRAISLLLPNRFGTSNIALKDEALMPRLNSKKKKRNCFISQCLKNRAADASFCFPQLIFTHTCCKEIWLMVLLCLNATWTFITKTSRQLLFDLASCVLRSQWIISPQIFRLSTIFKTLLISVNTSLFFGIFRVNQYSTI